jgi:hypothetical protein
VGDSNFPIIKQSMSISQQQVKPEEEQQTIFLGFCSFCVVSWLIRV